MPPHGGAGARQHNNVLVVDKNNQILSGYHPSLRVETGIENRLTATDLTQGKVNRDPETP
jgi:hypothetical protein